jgi:hypothetical protein
MAIPVQIGNPSRATLIARIPTYSLQSMTPLATKMVPTTTALP